VDSSTRDLVLRIATINHDAHLISLWRLKLSFLKAGRVIGRAVISSSPIYRSAFPASAALLAITSRLILFILSFAHTLYVIGAPEKARMLLRIVLAGSEVNYSNRRSGHTVVFQALCLLTFIGFASAIVVGVQWNPESLRLADQQNTSTMKEPVSEYLPAGMYHDLGAAARMLLPARRSSAAASNAPRECSLVNDGTSSDVYIAAAQEDSTPLWAREVDSAHLDTFERMLVRSHTALLFMADSCVNGSRSGVRNVACQYRVSMCHSTALLTETTASSVNI
jgi:hypothetical protein